LSSKKINLAQSPVILRTNYAGAPAVAKFYIGVIKTGLMYQNTLSRATSASARVAKSWGRKVPSGYPFINLYWTAVAIPGLAQLEISAASKKLEAGALLPSVFSLESRHSSTATSSRVIHCDSIIMDEAQIRSIPEIAANHAEAQLVHEAAIGRIAGEQLMKLMSLGLTEEEAEDTILKGFLK
jgi:hypothetical protein